jgi:hypothetical protein
MSTGKESYSDKSYVTLELCPICRENTGTLLLDRRLKNTFEKHTINPGTTCDVCKDKYLKEGVMLINPETGSLAVLKKEAFKRMFNVPVPVHMIAYAEEKVVQWLINQQSSAEAAA